MKFLKRLFRRGCPHDWEPTDWWILDEGEMLRMDTCPGCGDFRLQRVSDG